MSQNINTVISEVLQEIETAEIEVLKVDGQLEHYKEKKLAKLLTEKDIEWHRKAIYFKKLKEAELRSLHRQLNNLQHVRKEQEKKERMDSFERVFVDVCKEKLKPETFDKLSKITHKRMEMEDVLS